MSYTERCERISLRLTPLYYRKRYEGGCGEPGAMQAADRILKRMGWLATRSIALAPKP